MKKIEVKTYKATRMTRNGGVDPRPGNLSSGEPPMYWEAWVDSDGNVIRLSLANCQAQGRPTAYGHQIASERRQLGWLPVAEIPDEDFERIVEERQAACKARGCKWDEINRSPTDVVIEKLADVIKATSTRAGRGA